MPDEAIETPEEETPGGYRFLRAVEDGEAPPDMGLERPEREVAPALQRIENFRVQVHDMEEVESLYVERDARRPTEGSITFANGGTLNFPNEHGQPFPQVIRTAPTASSLTYSMNWSTAVTANVFYDPARHQIYYNYYNGNWWSDQHVITDEDRYYGGAQWRFDDRARTPEDVERARQAQEETNRRIAEDRRREQERITAARQARQRGTNRARELLMAHLNPEQRDFYEQQGYFDIEGSLGTKFRIGRGTSGNVRVMTPEGETFAHICAHPEGSLPEPDVHLAQMLALMTDEQAFIQRANLHAGRRVFYVTDTEGNTVADFSALPRQQGTLRENTAPGALLVA